MKKDESRIFVCLTYDGRAVSLTFHDDGMYRVYIVHGYGTEKSRRVLVGVLEDRRDAVWLFNAKVQKLASDWERTV